MASSRPYVRGDGFPNRTFQSGDNFLVTPQHRAIRDATTALEVPRARVEPTTMVGIFDRAGASAMSPTRSVTAYPSSMTSSPGGGTASPNLYQTTSLEAAEAVASGAGHLYDSTRFVPGESQECAHADWCRGCRGLCVRETSRLSSRDDPTPLGCPRPLFHSQPPPSPPPASSKRQARLHHTPCRAVSTSTRR